MTMNTFILVKSKEEKVHQLLKNSKRQTKVISIIPDKYFENNQFTLEKFHKKCEICTSNYDKQSKKFRTIQNEDWISPDINDNEYLKYLRSRQRRINNGKIE